MLYNKDLRDNEFEVPTQGYKIKDADIMIAAITSCTNTANPKNVIAAGLIAKKLINLGFKKKNKIKTSFAPGSKVTAEILKKSGLQKYLDELVPLLKTLESGHSDILINSSNKEQQVEIKIKENIKLSSKFINDLSTISGIDHIKFS